MNDRRIIRRLLGAPFSEVSQLAIGERDVGEWFVRVTLRDGRVTRFSASSEDDAKATVADLERWRTEPDQAPGPSAGRWLALGLLVLLILAAVWLLR